VDIIKGVCRKILGETNEKKKTSSKNNNIKGVLNPNFRLFSFELKKIKDFLN